MNESQLEMAKAVTNVLSHRPQGLQPQVRDLFQGLTPKHRVRRNPAPCTTSRVQAVR